jgi:hypothetical protein
MAGGELKAVHRIPYSDLSSVPAEKRRQYVEAGEPLCFGHTLTDQIGGQLAAGLQITGFYDDRWDDWPISRYLATMVATRATRSLR